MSADADTADHLEEQYVRPRSGGIVEALHEAVPDTLLERVLLIK
jgi:hypothetical protein